MDDSNKSNRYERKPNFDFTAKLSRDGRYYIIKRLETWIVPRKYFDVIAQNHALELGEAVAPQSPEKPPKKGKRHADSNG